MDSFIHKLFGASGKYTPAHIKEPKKKTYRTKGSPVDLKSQDAHRPRRPWGSESTGSVVRYTLDNQELELQKKAVKKHGKHKIFRISNRHTKKKAREAECNEENIAKYRRSLLLVARHSPCLFVKGDLKPLGGQTYDKYIPVENFDLPVYRLSKLDRQFPLCWFDLQTWYRETRTKRQDKENAKCRENVRLSISDTIVGQSDSGKSVSENDSNTSSSSKTIDQLQEDERFGLSINETYCTIASSKTPYFIIELFVQLPPKNEFSLCHLKTEMIVHCLQKFFYPVADIHVMWLQELKTQALRLCSVRRLRRHLPPDPPGTDFIVTSDQLKRMFHEMKAFIVVSPDAAVVLKHWHLCFLHTLTTIIQISPEHLAVFEQIRKSNQLSVIHEIS